MLLSSPGTLNVVSRAKTRLAHLDSATLRLARSVSRIPDTHTQTGTHAPVVYIHDTYLHIHLHIYTGVSPTQMGNGQRGTHTPVVAQEQPLYVCAYIHRLRHIYTYTCGRAGASAQTTPCPSPGTAGRAFPPRSHLSEYTAVDCRCPRVLGGCMCVCMSV